MFMDGFRMPAHGYFALHLTPTENVTDAQPPFSRGWYEDDIGGTAVGCFFTTEGRNVIFLRELGGVP
jgi:hypothetical protein